MTRLGDVALPGWPAESGRRGLRSSTDRVGSGGLEFAAATTCGCEGCGRGRRRLDGPATHHGYEFSVAGVLLVSGPEEGDQLMEAVRTGYERGKGSLEGYEPSDLKRRS
jgi:hypothetical protein